jgi:myo-inositol 2-dehydrogenase / D-chiro-inositol 1-dehydrogenase
MTTTAPLSAPQSAPLGVLILSAVRHAASYLPVLQALPAVEVRGIVEESGAPDWAHHDAGVLGQAHDLPVTRDVEAALARQDVDLVLVCSEPTRHARLAMAALDAGKHVLVDKPFATSLDDATALLQTAEVAPGRLTMMNRLFSPQVVRARAAIDAGQIGMPLSLDLEWLASDGLSGEAVERAEFVTDRGLSGGGEIMNFLTYPITTIRYLTGANIRSVYTEAGTFFFDPHKQAGVEDLGMLSLELDHGIMATITVGRVPQAPSYPAVSSTLRVIGSHGHIAMDESQPVLDIWQRKERRGVRIGGDAGQRSVEAVFASFVDDIRMHRAPRVTAADGWATVAAIDAAYRSIAAHQPVEVWSLDEIAPESHMTGETDGLV